MAGKRLLSQTGWWVLPLVAAVTIAVDQITKYLVVSNLGLYESWSPIRALEGRLDIHHVTNTGAAFGLFQNGGLFFVIVAVVVSFIILFYYRHLPDGQWLIRLSLGFQLGGAVGNLVDRIRLGHVIDFVDVHFWPVFNVADSAIVVGVFLLAFLLLRDDYSERSRKSDTVDSSEGAGERVSSS